MKSIFAHPAFPYCAPLLVWALLGLLETLHPHAVYAVYPLKTFVAGVVVVQMLVRLPPLRCQHLAGTLGVGLLAWCLWVGLDPYLVKREATDPGFNPYPLFGPGEITYASIFFRALGATLVVPVVEEIFWRGFLMRYLQKEDFVALPLGVYTHLSFWGTTLAFTLAHGAEWAIALPVGILFGWWFIRTKSLGDVILAHAVTNLLLAGYIVTTGRWYFW